MAFCLTLFYCLLAIITVGIFLGHVWWLPEAVSSHAAAVDQQFTLTLIVAGSTFFLAQIGLGVLIWRYRARGAGRAEHWHENTRLEAIWTAVTAVVFIALAVQGNRVWAKYFLAVTPPDAMTIEVVGQQFAWNIRYPGPDGKFGRTDPKLINDSLGRFLGIDENDPASRDDLVTQNIMAVPVNRPVRVILRSKDVTHAFFVPQLRVKQDAVPGLAINVPFTAIKTGEYEIACAELCGMQHYKMRGRLLIMEPAEYERWFQERVRQAAQ